MTVTKVDLLDLKFSKSLMGYRKAEVDAALAEAADALGHAAEEQRRLLEKVKEMEKALTTVSAREESLSQALAATQKVIEDLKVNARDEAHLIVEEAKAKAAAIIREAHESVSSVKGELTDLRHRRVEFEMGFRVLLETHLRFLDMAERGEALPALGRTLPLEAGDDDGGK